MKKDTSTTETSTEKAPKKTTRTSKTTAAKKTATKTLSAKRTASSTVRRKATGKKVADKTKSTEEVVASPTTVETTDNTQVSDNVTATDVTTVVDLPAEAAKNTEVTQQAQTEPEKKSVHVRKTAKQKQQEKTTQVLPIADVQIEQKQDADQQRQERQPRQDRQQPSERQQRQEQKILPLPDIEIHDIMELAQAPQRAIVLTDQQIQQLTLEDIQKRHLFLQHALANVLDYDVVISDTNIWLELLLGHTSSHSDPRYNARLQFERQLEFISKFTKFRGCRFMMLSETYEEIDRFATMQDPTDYREADFTDSLVCLNTAARLAKRLILSQQRENRLRIDNIGAESHHASFADPAIIRCVAELFATGKKVLVLTNDASVAIRSIGICDDLQRHNNISDEIWNAQYAPLRPMVFTFDDLKLLDYYTRQYHYIQMASGQPWMHDISQTTDRNQVEPLTLWDDAFRPGDKHKTDNLPIEIEPKADDRNGKKDDRNNKRQQHKPNQKRKATPEQEATA